MHETNKKNQLLEQSLKKLAEENEQLNQTLQKARSKKNLFTLEDDLSNGNISQRKIDSEKRSSDIDLSSAYNDDDDDEEIQFHDLSKEFFIRFILV